MNDDLHSELLSAYHDGEVTPMERAEVERLLADEEQARREVDELRDLSTTLSSTGGESAPAGLYEAVMRRIERESLIPPSDTTSADAASSRVERDSASVTWVAVAAAVTTLAAALLVSVQLMHDPNRPTAPTVLADASGPSPNLADQSGDRLEIVAANERAVEAKEVAARLAKSLDSLGSRDKSREVQNAMPEKDADRKRAAASAVDAAPVAEPMRANRPDVDPVPDSAGAFRGVASAGERGVPTRRSGLTFDEDLERAEVGDVVRALENDGDQVAVVRLTVVDRRQGLEALQFLLARHEIDRDLGDLEGRESEKSSVDRLGTGLEAVFVEATPDQLASTISEMQSIAGFRSLEVEEPIALAKLNGYGGRGIAMALLDEQAESTLGRRRIVGPLGDHKRAPEAIAPGPSLGAAAAPEPAEPTPVGGSAPPTPAPGTRPKLEIADGAAFSKKAEFEPKGLAKPASRDGEARGGKPAGRRSGDEFAQGADPQPGDTRRLHTRSRQRNLVVPPALLARSTPRRTDAAERPAAEADEEELASATAELAERKADRALGRAFAGRASIPDETARRKQLARRALPVVFVIVEAVNVRPTPPAAEQTADDEAPEGA